MEALRTALNHLYEPRVLRAGPLPALFELADRSQGAAALQRLLDRRHRGAAPRPRDPARFRPIGAPIRSCAAAIREQVPQTTVAADLGLSVRHVQREEKQARELLADYLWKTHHLAERRHLLIGAAVRPTPGRRRTPRRPRTGAGSVARQRPAADHRGGGADPGARWKRRSPCSRRSAWQCEVDLRRESAAGVGAAVADRAGAAQCADGDRRGAVARALLQVTVAADADAIAVTLDGHGAAATVPAADPRHGPPADRSGRWSAGHAG